MSNIKFPPLTADQVECRVGVVSAKGCSILLYKTARTDMDILDATVGPERWQNEFFDAGGKLFCRLSIKVGDEWISKSDCGVEGNVGEEKSQASDARKRAGFAWGIGRELYNSPFIWLNLPVARGTDGRYKLESYPRLEVTSFESDGKNVTNLVICDDHGNVLFRHGAALKQARREARPAGQAAIPAPAPVTEAPADMFADERKAGALSPATAAVIDDNLAIALDELKRVRSRADLIEVNNRYKSVYGEYGAKKSDIYLAELNKMAAQYPRSNK